MRHSPRGARKSINLRHKSNPMKKIVYYVASSLDGFIAGPNEDISLFMQRGPGVDQYRADLQAFQTVIMGRRTYEFGYQYGLQPGQAAYPHMAHHIFSNSLSFTDAAENVHIEPLDLDRVRQIRAAAPTDIYLCGGGQFAGWLLNNQLIDVLKIKLNPILLGHGIPLFGDARRPEKLQLTERRSFPEGLEILTYHFDKQA